MRLPTLNTLAPGAFALGIMLAGGSAFAGSQAEITVAQAAPMQGAEQAPAAPVSDTEIDQFISAATEIQVLHEGAQEKIASAEDETKAAALREETERSMKSAIEESGLTLQRYQEIFVAYQSNPQVNEKITKKMTN